jgi:hypothetical protein
MHTDFIHDLFPTVLPILTYETRLQTPRFFAAGDCLFPARLVGAIRQSSHHEKYVLVSMRNF